MLERERFAREERVKTSIWTSALVSKTNTRIANELLTRCPNIFFSVPSQYCILQTLSLQKIMLCSDRTLVTEFDPVSRARGCSDKVECLSAGVVRVDGEWGRVVPVGRERSCSGMSSRLPANSVEKSVICI